MSALDDEIAKARLIRKLTKTAIPGVGMPNRHGPPRAKRKTYRPGRSHGRRRGAPIVLPLFAFYGQSPERERARARFYAAIAREFGDWSAAAPAEEPLLGEPGRDGIPQELRKTGDAFTTRKSHNIAAAPLEYLFQTNVLADKVSSRTDETSLRAAAAANGRRWEAGVRARSDFHGEMIVGIKSVDFAAIGGGGSGGRPIADFTIDCIASVGRLRDMMPAGDMAVLEAIVHSDRWIWRDGAPSAYSDRPAERRRQQQAETKRRAPIFEAIRRALDYAALRYGLMTASQFVTRWPAAPVLCPIVGPVAAKVREFKEREAAMALVKQIAAELRDFVPEDGPVILNAVIRRQGDKIIIDSPVFKRVGEETPASGRRR